MTHKFKIALFVLLMIGVNVWAQEKWSLDECVSYALENNLQLNDFKYTNQSNKETYAQSIRNLLPSINASSDYFINSGRAEDPNTGTFVTQDFFRNNYSLESSIDLFQGFQKINSIKASKFLYKATKEEVLQQKFLLAFRVMQAFYDIQFFQGLVTISQEQLAVSKSNYELVNKQIELGLKAGADLYEAESLLLTDELNLTQSKNQLAAAKLALIQEMNLEGTSQINIQEQLTDIGNDIGGEEIQSDSIYTFARDFLPLIKAQELRAKAAKKQVAVSRGRLYPSLTLFAGVGTGYFETRTDSLGSTLPFRDQFRDNTNQYIGVSLNVPISNGWSARSRIKQSKIEKLRAENNLKTQEQVLFQTIQQLVQDHNSLLVELEQSDQKVKAQNLAFNIAQKRYEKGLINALELFTAKNLFASAQNENLQVRLRSEINKSTIDFYKGLPVFNIN
ncbi:TolC family protein [Maribacter sp. PR1]|uniref:TolC family protein n=1 Tax=Maribacter cobaltidurans TaxID=1178778 RepID=A0ABU7IRZ2_9FLAO|nr:MULTISPECIES: TolC family protein [Maribacter]MDC6388225.1 TolC family protein [Maribacter sp. PR1]MEE1975613.1 TolC family protein [Maribacter cobaltidurans]